MSAAWNRPLRTFGAAVLILGMLGSAVLARGNGPAPALERALARVDAERIRADIEYIACDEMQGRDTPSPGLRLTARFLRNRLQHLGVPPGNGERYLDPYELEHQLLLAEGTSLTLKGRGEARELVYGRDYYLFTSDYVSGRVEGGAVYVGDLDDELPQLEDRWAVMQQTDRPWYRAVRAVTRAGAAGLVFLPSESASSEDFEAARERALDRAATGRVRLPGEARERVEDPAYFPVLFLAPEAARDLVGRALPSARRGKSLVPGRSLGIELVDVRQSSAADHRVDVENVCAFWPGSDPRLSREVVLVTAHYDHVGTATDGSVFNGADDNGTGTAGLLALAEALVTYGPLPRSVMLIWVSGEERGLLGSAAWVAEPSLPEGYRAVADINLDMIGRNDPAEIQFTPTRDGPFADQYTDLARQVETLAPLAGFEKLGSADEYYERSDHVNFAKLGIPVVFVFAGIHEDYHEVTDTADKVDPDKVARVVQLILRVLVSWNVPPAGV